MTPNDTVDAREDAAREGPGPAIEPGAPEDAATAAAGGEDAATLRDRWLRAEADLQNLRRRARLEREEARRGAEERVMLEIIDALDDLDRALDAAAAAEAPPAWSEGVRLVASRLRDALGRHGVVPLDPAGEPFDPRFHEAMLETDAPEGVAPGAVVQVVLRGWRRGERALRAARVVVARRPEEPPA